MNINIPHSNNTNNTSSGNNHSAGKLVGDSVSNQSTASHSTKAAQQTQTNTTANTQAINASSLSAIQSTTHSTTPSATQATVKAIVQTLQQQGSSSPTINAQILSSQVLNEQTIQRLAQVNPDLAKALQQHTQQATSQQTTQSQSNTTVNTPINTRQALTTQAYLVKLGNITAPLSATSNGLNVATTNGISQGIITIITTNAFTAGDTVELELNKNQALQIKPSINTVKPVIAQALTSVIAGNTNVSQLFQLGLSLIHISEPTRPY